MPVLVLAFRTGPHHCATSRCLCSGDIFVRRPTRYRTRPDSEGRGEFVGLDHPAAKQNYLSWKIVGTLGRQHESVIGNVLIIRRRLVLINTKLIYPSLKRSDVYSFAQISKMAVGLMRANPPPISEAERHRRWLERQRPGQVEVTIEAPPPDEFHGVSLTDAENEQAFLVEFYVYVNPYPHNTARVHKGQCHRRVGQKGERFGPFPTKEAALEQATRFSSVRSVHLCKRCKP